MILCYLLLNHEMHIYKKKKETKRVILYHGLVSITDERAFSSLHLLLN
jgi:hypothetical protein